MRRILTWVVPALLGFGIAGLDIGAAASQAITSNINNSVSTATVAPPENVEATSTITLIPLSCAVTVTWTAPDMAGIGGYEVRRVLASTNAELDPPSFTTDLFYVDDRTPLTLIDNAFEYQVRTVLGGTSWRSEWVTADAGVTVLCLSPLGAAPESGAAPDGFVPAAVESDETPVQPDQPLEETPPLIEVPELPTDADTLPSTSTAPTTSVAANTQPDSEPPSSSVPPVVTVPSTTNLLPTDPLTTGPVATLLNTPTADIIET